MPNIFFATSSGYIVEWSPEAGTFESINYLGRFYSDIAIAPDGKLYGITYNALYSIDLVTDTDQYIGSLSGQLTPLMNGLTGANGFDIGLDGTALITSGNTSIIAQVDLSSGSVTNVGIMDYSLSAGDVLFHDGSVYVSTLSNTLVELVRSGDRYVQIGSEFISSNQAYGLAAPVSGDTGITVLQGDSAYELNDAASLLGPGLIQEFNLGGAYITGAATGTTTVLPPDPVLLTNDQLFARYGEMGFLAQYTLASYHLDLEREVVTRRVNDQNYEADRMYRELGEGIQYLDSSDLGLAVEQTGDPEFPTRGLSEGIYTNGNAAALVARTVDGLFLSFRGTNDNAGRAGWNVFTNTPDERHWVGSDDHYDLFTDLILAVARYSLEPSNGIERVFVSGHSLGASMVEALVDDWSASNLTAVTFASPGYGLPDDLGEPRLTNVWLDGDPIRGVSWLQDNDGDANRIFHNMEGDILHSMSLYNSFVGFFRTEGFDLNQYRFLDGSDYERFYAFDDLSRVGFQIGEAADHMDGSQYREVIAGGAQDDRIEARRGDDYVVGGSGSDWADLGWGHDIYVDYRLEGTVDADTVIGGLGRDTIEGGFGNDEIAGGVGADWLSGGGGNDRIYGGGGSDIINAGAGSDTVSGGTGADIVRLDDGDDLFQRHCPNRTAGTGYSLWWTGQ